MVTKARWKFAQRYERGYWRRRAREIEAGSTDQLDWYGWRRDRLRRLLGDVGHAALADGTAEVLEIGHGPVGIISFFPGSRRVGIDPLQLYFHREPTLSVHRNPSVLYLQGEGEALPLETSSFDLVIIDNCIDHVRDVGAVLGEARRVLREDGLLFVTVNCRTSWGYGMHWLLSRFGMDPGHPHSFTRGRLRNVVGARFEVLELRSQSFREAWRSDLTAGSVKAGAKALLGTSEFVSELLARKVA